MKILNYKKPAFWVSIVAVAVVVGVVAGLMANPSNKDEAEDAIVARVKDFALR